MASIGNSLIDPLEGSRLNEDDVLVPGGGRVKVTQDELPEDDEMQPIEEEEDNGEMEEGDDMAMDE